MKKLFVFITLCLTASAIMAQQFRGASFLSDIVATNAVNGRYGGITVSNAASAPLGGFTNINSWLSAANGTTVGTNALKLTWTNYNGIWVIPTNNTLGTVSGIAFVTNDSTALVQDVPLFVTSGQIPMTVTTNNFIGDASSFMVSPASLSCRIFGDSGAGGTLNLVFVGLPDGVNEVTGANGQPLTFQWGITPAAGTTVVSTNFPTWKFAGCKTLRLRSATLTTSTAANIGVTIQALGFNAFPP